MEQYEFAVSCLDQHAAYLGLERSYLPTVQTGQIATASLKAAILRHVPTGRNVAGREICNKCSGPTYWTAVYYPCNELLALIYPFRDLMSHPEYDASWDWPDARG